MGMAGVLSGPFFPRKKEQMALPQSLISPQASVPYQRTPGPGRQVARVLH
jgi:hypothetical protein